MPPAPPHLGPGRIPRAIFLLGLTSLLTDVSSEMIFALLPLFLTAGLGAGAVFLGLVEGVADAVSSLLKLASGHLVDRTRRRKPLVLAGYGLATLVRPLIALATAPWHVLAVRVTDRVGKGLRTTPRDVLIASAARPGEAGRAFGFHRAMDHAGAVLGPLLASALLAAGLAIRGVFALSIVPGLLAVGCVLLLREPVPGPAAPAGGTSATRAPAPGSALPGPLPRTLKTWLGILALFSLGNASDAFLLLRAHELGVPVAVVPLLWSALHVSKVACSSAGGRLSDRMPRVRLIAAGWGVYAASYVGLALARGPVAVFAIFLVYGAYYGLTEPAERALLRDLVPEEQRGRAYGAYHFVVGAAAIPAGLLAGALWQTWGATPALAFGAVLAGMASVLLLAWSRNPEVRPTPRRA